MSDWTRDFPRLGELAQVGKALDGVGGYFADFQDILANPLAREHYAQWEELLSTLDESAWLALLERARPFVAKPDDRRGRSQLFDKLNEARGYRILAALECHDICFLPERAISTPDLSGYSEPPNRSMQRTALGAAADAVCWLKESHACCVPW